MKRSVSISIGIAVLAACGDLTPAGSDPPVTPAIPADGGDGAVVDAGDAAAPVLCHGDFGPLSLVLMHGSPTNGSTTYDVDSVAITTDELHIYATLFDENAGNVEKRRIYAMDRGTRGEELKLDDSRPVAIGLGGSTPSAFDVSLSPDDTTLFYSHRDDTVSPPLNTDIFSAHRDPGGTISGEAELDTRINGPGSTQFHAHLGATSLYFTVAVTDPDAGVQGQRDIFTAALTGPLSRGPLSGFADPALREDVPVPSRDERELFFSSNRFGGENKVFLAQRGLNDISFGAPAEITFVNEDKLLAYDPQYLSADGCRLYVLRDRKDLLVSVRAP